MAVSSVRPEAFAGQLYPQDERVLRMQIAELLAAAVPLEQISPPKAVIVPHAAYLYSGAVAASAYRTLAGLRDRIRRVVMLGPAHQAATRDFVIPAAQAFSTPLGEVPLNHADWLMLQARDDVRIDDALHCAEHGLEVQLPFLQTLFDSFSLVPVLAGDVSGESMAGLLEMLWGGPETLLVISSGLSQHLPYRQAQWVDRSTVEQVLDLNPGLGHEQACGAPLINGLVLAARRRGLRPHLLDLRNSGDTAGDRGRVFGYASIAFCETEPAPHVRH